MGLVEELWSRASWAATVFVLVSCWIVVTVGQRLHERRRLYRTGGRRAPNFAGRLPWGVDLVYRTLRASAQHTNRELWTNIFRTVRSHTAEFRVLGRRIVFTDDPENIKAILATQFADYGKGAPFHEEFEAFLGDSIFTTDGARWHASRQLLRPQFIKDRVSDLHTFETHLQTLFAAMSVGGNAAATAAVLAARATGTGATFSANGRVLCMSDLFFRYTLDVTTDFLLGKDTQSLTIPRQEFAEAFNEVQRVQGLITRTGPANRFIPRGSYNRNLRVIEHFIHPFIDRALLLPPAALEKTIHDDGDDEDDDDGGQGGGRYTFLHALAQFTRDRKVLRDQLMAVLLAGRDTTAATLSWAVYELSKKPACVQRLRAEVKQVVGVEGDPDCRCPTYADLKAMKTLQHVLNETLRMYPAVPFNVRLALRDTTLPRGGGPDGTAPVAVLKDTPIGYSTLVMQRRPDLYPPHLPHPDEFCPERWDHWQPKPWQYIPFNGGPRICIGQQFALTEMGYVLVRLFQKFERVVSHMDAIDGGKPTLKADIVLQPADGVHVAFYEADAA
ncbi:cytochrome p450 alkane monooxygenase [Niveomyces insectorum RCEF 264]|uniref:Cytochrome p450 alkane monooxygenase n=1 Tax=Niveomyces insectorum RCEF 264 TaxID=1081102 RepID=A0A167MTS2_9HYPO|nr:cytochrome p450 alkane monooxygenase [Niveomyces insectorum RCEF 264]